MMKTPSSMTIRKKENARQGGFNIGHSTARFDLRKAKETSMEIMVPEKMRWKPRLEPIIAMLIGRRGRGKTLGMTYLGAFQKARYKHLGLPNLIGSNYWNEFADILNPELVPWFNTEGLFDPRARRMYATVDEAGSQFANRRSLSQVNVDFMQVLTQIRKLETEMVFTTQFPQWIDMGVLYQIDLFIGMDMDMDANGGVDLNMAVWDWWGQWTGRNQRKIWPPQDSDIDWECTLVDADQMFGKYLTNQIIPPVWAKNRKQVIVSQWDDHMPEAEISVDETGVDMFTARARSAMEADINSIDDILKLADPEKKGFLASDFMHLARKLGVTNRAVWYDMLKKAGLKVDGDGRVSW